MIIRHDLRQARYERACWWLEHGIAVVPLKPQSKELQPGYGAHLAHIVDIAFARKWFLNTDANLGIVLGSPSGLAVADWDDQQAYTSWRLGPGAGVETLIEQTKRGYHVFFTGDNLAPATRNDCEFKTQGICMVSPSIHPSGVVYRITSNASVIRINRENTHILFPFLSEALSESNLKDEDGNISSLLDGVRKIKNERALGNGLVARIKAARPIVEEMRSAGVKLQRGGRATLVGLCPFHQDHSPSLWVYPESGLWGCNKPECPAAGVHDVINFRGMQRGLSNEAAIKQLADEFLRL